MGKTLPNISFKVIYITNIKEFSLNLALMGFFEIDMVFFGMYTKKKTVQKHPGV